MKKLAFIFMLFIPIFSFGQLTESFADGDFTVNPAWTGTTTNFMVNAAGQLQSKATAASTSYLFTPSEAIDTATWECWVKVNYNPSSGNYPAIYLVSDSDNPLNGCNGYFVKILPELLSSPKRRFRTRPIVLPKKIPT